MQRKATLALGHEAFCGCVPPSACSGAVGGLSKLWWHFRKSVLAPAPDSVMDPEDSAVLEKREGNVFVDECVLFKAP